MPAVNEIVAVLGNRSECTTATVYQYNYGERLRIVKDDLPEHYRVDFANSISGQSKSMLGSADRVLIPYEYFVPGSYIHAWIVYLGADYAITKGHIIIPISPKAQNTDETPEPEPQSIIDQAIAALNDGVDRAETAADNAEDAASHYPRINNGYWEIWDPASGAYVSTGVQAQGPQGNPGSDWQDATSRVTSLDTTPIAGATVLETVGIPLYVSDISQYAGYGITDSGWYVFARVTAPEGVTVTASTTVTGAAGNIATYGEDHVDVAVKFEVAAQSQAVTVDWGVSAETYVFKATDLAVRNLDYRATFYVYDLAPYAAWTYALTTDATFVAGKNYYTEENGVYSLAEVTAGEAVPANTYYNHSKLTLSGMVKNVTYRLDEPLDCALEIALPEINEDGHGAWFEFQLRHTGSTSITLLPPTGVKGATAGASAAISAGLNVVDLHYTDVDNVKMWSLANVHTSIPA